LSIRVLVADDDPDFLDVTAYALRRAGFIVNAASNGEEALDIWRAEDPDIVLLDVQLPNLPGYAVCQTIRNTSATPVVLLSGAKRESDIIHGFEVGADDYITKPFSIHQLVMRLRAIHRRATGLTADISPKRLVLGPLVVDLDSFSATIEGKPVQLTRLEFRLLYCLAANEGRVVAMSKLVDFAWGMDGEADASLMKTHVSHIRRKLAQVSSLPISIRAFPSVGYSLHLSGDNSTP